MCDGSHLGRHAGMLWYLGAFPRKDELTKNGMAAIERDAPCEQLLFLVHLVRLSTVQRDKTAQSIEVMNRFQDRPRHVREQDCVVAADGNEADKYSCGF